MRRDSKYILGGLGLTSIVGALGGVLESTLLMNISGIGIVAAAFLINIYIISRYILLPYIQDEDDVDEAEAVAQS